MGMTASRAVGLRASALPEQTDLQTSPRVRLEQIVNGSLTCRRTVHTIDDGEWLANYAFQQTGNLYWIRSR